MRAQSLECYLAALRDMARYAVDLDESITPPHRESLEDLADQVSSGDEAVLRRVAGDPAGTAPGLSRPVIGISRRH